MSVGGTARLERAECDAERLSSIDDQATRTEQLVREAALQRHAARAALEPQHQPGVCTNCGEQCAPRAIYCDALCRGDHERRLRSAAAGGRA